jgi:hypothetical protein
MKSNYLTIRALIPRKTYKGFPLIFPVRWYEEMRNKYQYQAFGLQIESEYELPELIKSYFEKKADVHIQICDLSSLWEKLSTTDSLIIVKNNFVLFRIENLATFCIFDGNQILVSPESGAETDRIRLYVLGSCMGALFMQRDTLCLHGSAIEIDGKAYAIVGKSGAGKSTLAAGFLSKGYPLLTDDVIAVSFDDNNQPIVVPGYPQQKLWKESLQKFGMEHNEYRPLFERENKFAVPISEFTNKPVPLEGIIELSHSEDESIHFHEVTGLERIHVVMRQTFRRSFLPKNRIEWHFDQSVKLVSNVSIKQLQRPVEPFTAHELVSQILQSISVKEEVVC